MSSFLLMVRGALRKSPHGLSQLNKRLIKKKECWYTGLYSLKQLFKPFFDLNTQV